MKVEIKKLEKHEDKRGWLVEVLRSDKIHEDINHIYFSVSNPDAVRGNHYHTRKIEWLCVIKGMASLLLKDNDSKERKELVLSGENPIIVKIFPNVTHAIKNVGSDNMHLIAIVNEVFDPKDPDTYPKIVIP